MGGEFWREWIHVCVQLGPCSPETITTLLTGYTPTQNKKLKKKEQQQQSPFLTIWVEMPGFFAGIQNPKSQLLQARWRNLPSFLSVQLSSSLLLQGTSWILCSLIHNDRHGFWAAENGECSSFSLENSGDCSDTGNFPSSPPRGRNPRGVKIKVAPNVMRACLFSSKPLPPT